MRQRQYRTFVGDFETTVFEGQDYTEVWASAIVELQTEDVIVLGSIEATLRYLIETKGNIIIYYHNLKFDGNFWLDYLLREGYEFNRTAEGKMLNRQFKCAISDRGQWYTITIKINDKIIEIRDSLKLLPFSVKKIGKSFGTKHRKKEIEYKGFRYANCPITETEREYIANDVLVVKEALEILFSDGHNRLTIGSCCYEEFKRGFDKEDFETFFPNLYEIRLDISYGCENAGEYIRKSYTGGWCYVKKGKENVLLHSGITIDVNSLYPSVMHSTSGNYYPVGVPCFWKGNYLDQETHKDNIYYFVRFKCRFVLKPNYLPTVQIKGTLLYRGTEYLETSDIYVREEESYSRYYEKDGKLVDSVVTITMTKTSYEMFREHYEVYDFEILDGCYFRTEIGLFDNYINKYKKIKMESTGAVREEAKLFLNNLYGKLASSTVSSYKVPYLDKDTDIVKFYMVEEYDKIPGYIAIGSAITSYARHFDITVAQLNYDRFIYSDTDSNHLEGTETPKGVTLHPSEFNCWALESEWDEAIFTRQKTYIEHVIKRDGKEVDPYYDVKCAGMPEASKQEFLQEYTINDFHKGLEVGGKLRPKRMKGGVVLVDTTYKMK